MSSPFLKLVLGYHDKKNPMKQNVQTYVAKKKTIKLENIRRAWIFFQKLINIGPGKKSKINKRMLCLRLFRSTYVFLHTLMSVYHCHKPVFRPKMAIFRRAGMREGGLPLLLAFHYLIFMIWRACDLNLVMISLLASKCQHFKLRGLQYHFIKQLKNRYPNFKALPFWS